MALEAGPLRGTAAVGRHGRSVFVWHLPPGPEYTNGPQTNANRQRIRSTFAVIILSTHLYNRPKQTLKSSHKLHLHKYTGDLSQSVQGTTLLSMQ